jgi:hypothetical protein
LPSICRTLEADEPGDGNPPRLHGLRDFADQFDLQQAVVEGRALDLDVVRQAELALEGPRRNALVQEFALVFSAFRPSTVRTLCSAVIVISSGEKPATASEIWYRSSLRRSTLQGG